MIFKHLLLGIYKRLLFLHKISNKSENDLDISFWIDDFKLPVTVTTDMANHLLKGTEQTNDLNAGPRRMYL